MHKACDGQAAAAGPDDAVAGIAARFVATPSSTQQSAEVLRVAAQHGLRVVARGAGTKLGWGMPPVAVDLVVDTTAMTGVVEHAAGDLITIARAGTPLADLQDVLAQA
ncbi:MAG: FAD-binding oxidoreductase, partial [Nocardioidaceae bacterium]|nr:FAD-binding oxidoreductase [Nocardioidaceae bacterium]